MQIHGIGIKLLYTVIAGAGIGAYLTKYIDSSNLKKYFGLFLSIVAIIDVIQTIKNKINEKSKKGGEGV